MVDVMTLATSSSILVVGSTSKRKLPSRERIRTSYNTTGQYDALYN